MRITRIDKTLLAFYFNICIILENDKLLSSKEQSIDQVNKSEVSAAERLEIENTLSQLEHKYILDSNTLKVMKIRPKNATVRYL